MLSGPWNHNIHYYDLVLRSVPKGCRRALDAGCGQGLLARRLAARSEEVIAMDIDHDTLMRAKAVSPPENVAAPVAEPKETLHEIRTVSNAILPGARLERRLFFRYSLIWRKP